jgi:hypothetical protein
MEGKQFIKSGFNICITILSIGIIVNLILIYYLYKLRESNYINNCTNGKLIDELDQLTFTTKGILFILLLIVGVIILFGIILIPFSKNSEFQD